MRLYYMYSVRKLSVILTWRGDFPEGGCQLRNRVAELKLQSCFGKGEVLGSGLLGFIGFRMFRGFGFRVGGFGCCVWGFRSRGFRKR